MITAPSPFSLIIFGASGHLAKLKLYPALYTLALKGRLPKDFAIVGYSRSEMDTAAFRTLVADAVEKDMQEVNKEKMNAFLKHVHYHQGQYNNPDDFAALAGELKTIEKGWENHVRLAYFSVPPTVFPDILQNLCKGGVHDHKRKKDFRCIVEKPVGHDLKSFERIKKELTTCFGEEEIYMLDHYLGKEAVRNMYYLRFANPILERLFKNTLIQHVEITAMEAAGLEGRAGYFEETGTLRDMFQSHMLMIASLLSMRLQEKENIRTTRLNALEQFYLPHAKDMNDVVLQGQYNDGAVGGAEVIGYREEEGVAKDSRTNTYVAMKLMTRMSKWEGVPFYLRSGKRLEKKETRISIQFQEPHPVGEGAEPNRLDIILQGEAGMRMFLQTKMGGTDPKFRPLILTDPLVCMGDCLPEHSLLILEAIHGKQQWFLTFEEVQVAWRLMDPVQAHLDDAKTPLCEYSAGARGPDEAEEWIGKDGITWF